MLKIYAALFIVGILGTVAYGAKYYYDSTQATIATLRENNAKLETAIQISEESIKMLQQDMAKFQELNQQLQADLQQAEAYGDDLRSKLREHNLTALALKKPGLLEGKMNGATAKLWRELEQDTGGDGDKPLPSWLQPREQTGTGNPSGDQSGEDTGSSSSETEASPAG
jgi:FtsZ-binding cell division protein ZapB